MPALSPDVAPQVAMIYSHLALADRLETLQGIHEQKQLAQISPVPFGPPEVAMLMEVAQGAELSTPHPYS